MGITCKPVGKMEGILRKVENEQIKEEQKNKGKDKKKNGMSQKR